MLDPYYEETQELRYKRKYLIINTATLLIMIGGCFMLFNSTVAKNIKVPEIEAAPADQPILGLHQSANKLIFVFTVTTIVIFILMRATRFMVGQTHRD